MRNLIVITALFATLMLVGCGGGLGSRASVNYSVYPAHVSSPNSCTGTFDCEYWGECTYQQGTCVAASSTHCKASAVCRTLGQCNLKGIACTL